MRTRLLEQIRADVYVSGTYVRDYLLEPESGKAEGHRYSLLEARQRYRCRAAEIPRAADAQEAAPFQGLTQELAAYWNVLEPVFSGPPAQRRATGTSSCATRSFRGA